MPSSSKSSSSPSRWTPFRKALHAGQLHNLIAQDQNVRHKCLHQIVAARLSANGGKTTPKLLKEQQEDEYLSLERRRLTPEAKTPVTKQLFMLQTTAKKKKDQNEPPTLAKNALVKVPTVPILSSTKDRGDQGAQGAQGDYKDNKDHTTPVKKHPKGYRPTGYTLKDPRLSNDTKSARTLKSKFSKKKNKKNTNEENVRQFFERYETYQNETNTNHNGVDPVRHSLMSRYSSSFKLKQPTTTQQGYTNVQSLWVLHLHVARAESLHNSDGMFGKSDPYVSVSINSDRLNRISGVVSGSPGTDTHLALTPVLQVSRVQYFPSFYQYFWPI